MQPGGPPASARPARTGGCWRRASAARSLSPSDPASLPNARNRRKNSPHGETSAEPMDEKLKVELASRIATREVLVVVGTGVSLAATASPEHPRGNPLASWKGLIA